MSSVLDITTTDEYQYLSCPGTVTVTIMGISNAAVLIGFGQAGTRTLGGGYYGDDDEPFLPAQGSIARSCDEIRVKSYVTGAPANVKLVAR